MPRLRCARRCGRCSDRDSVLDPGADQVLYDGLHTRSGSTVSTDNRTPIWPSFGGVSEDNSLRVARLTGRCMDPKCSLTTPFSG